MEFKQAMRTWRRMCEEHRECKECPADRGCMGSDFASSDESKIEAVLTKWAKEHPKKAIMDDFFERVPNAPHKEDGTPKACAKYLGYCNDCFDENGKVLACAECWRRPLEEVEG